MSLFLAPVACVARRTRVAPRNVVLEMVRLSKHLLVECLVLLFLRTSMLGVSRACSVVALLWCSVRVKVLIAVLGAAVISVLARVRVSVVGVVRGVPLRVTVRAGVVVNSRMLVDWAKARTWGS